MASIYCKKFSMAHGGTVIFVRKNINNENINIDKFCVDTTEAVTIRLMEFNFVIISV